MWQTSHEVYLQSIQWLDPYFALFLFFISSLILFLRKLQICSYLDTHFSDDIFILNYSRFEMRKRLKHFLCIRFRKKSTMFKNSYTNFHNRFCILDHETISNTNSETMKKNNTIHFLFCCFGVAKNDFQIRNAFSTQIIQTLFILIVHGKNMQFSA